MKHHFLPIFLLKQWAASDGRVATYRRRDGGHRVRHFHPRGIGYVTDLLALNRDYVGTMERQHLEKYVFQDVDSLAAKVRDKLNRDGADSLSSEDRVAWARFLMSLQMRQPQLVQMVRDVGKSTLLDKLQTTAEEDVILRQFGEPGGLADFLERQTPGMAENFGLTLLPSMLDDMKTIQRLASLKWLRVLFPWATHEVMISDAPSMLHAALDDPKFVWALPLSPRSAFFATEDEATIGRILGANSGFIVRALNVQACFQTRDRLFARGASNQNFVQRRWADWDGSPEGK